MNRVSMKQLLSPKDLARATGVSESSLKPVSYTHLTLPTKNEV